MSLLQLSTRDLSYFSASEMYTAQSFAAAASSLLTIGILEAPSTRVGIYPPWRSGLFPFSASLIVVDDNQQGA
jgi:hypothetical protein